MEVHDGTRTLGKPGAASAAAEREQSCQASVFETRMLLSSSRELLRERAGSEAVDAAGVHAAGEEIHGSSDDR
jgi:hypothetical protein